MRSLVLGGSRFIGKHLVEALVAAGHEVATLNRGVTAVDLPRGVERIIADRRDRDAFARAIASQTRDVVFDVSGYTVDDVAPVLDAYARRPFGRYVFTSSAAVYEYVGLAPVDEDFPKVGADGRRYAVDKVACESAIERFATDGGMAATIIRPSYVYGPDNPLLDREASAFARLRKRRPVLLPGSGNTLMHNGHVDDLADALVRAGSSPLAVGRAYTITGPHAIATGEYVRELGRIAGVEPRIVAIPPGDAARLDPPIFPFRWNESIVYSIERARRELAWEPRYDFADGHRHTYEWLNARPGLLDALPDNESREDALLARYGRAIR